MFEALTSSRPSLGKRILKKKNYSIRRVSLVACPLLFGAAVGVRSVVLVFFLNFLLSTSLLLQSAQSHDSYLVDPASSHMLVSKIKPCMSKFTLSHGETANGSLNQSRFLR